ncbi:hypothetical protein EXIGLDRAFT_411855 [Exidia glandulosa HHB12029]|uniref:Uncharacterized protein n=1 Tax=Exidia glandulosa HHB12029 TaxID=1314781 RepID=A0A165KPX6_EXIGL|nr:hypothetical protein EXIGLDRAFT_411855 [Exidia glandulosa HHB12029]
MGTARLPSSSVVPTASLEPFARLACVPQKTLRRFHHRLDQLIYTMCRVRVSAPSRPADHVYAFTRLARSPTRPRRVAVARSARGPALTRSTPALAVRAA